MTEIPAGESRDADGPQGRLGAALNPRLLIKDPRLFDTSPGRQSGYRTMCGLKSGRERGADRIRKYRKGVARNEPPQFS